MLASLKLFQANAQDTTILLCTKDPGQLTPAEAHRAMQVHLDCTVDTCQVRSRARTTLVEAKRMVLDVRAIPAPDRRWR